MNPFYYIIACYRQVELYKVVSLIEPCNDFHLTATCYEFIEHRFACFAEREVSKLTQTKVCNSAVSDDLLKYKKIIICKL